jgi:hypothetical protein
VVVNIRDTISKKKKGSTNRSQPIKKPIQQAIPPVIQSFNQPVFNKPTTPSTLTSSILSSQGNPNIPTTPSILTSSSLAPQEKPNILTKELKDQSALTKALIEQNTDDGVEEKDIKVNDLERVRIKKFDKPTPTIPTVPIVSTETIIQERPFYPSFKKINKESKDPIKQGLISQLFEEQGDDTEEINEMIRSSTEGLLRPTASFPNPLSGLSIPKLSNPLSKVKIPDVSSSLINFLNKLVEEEPTVDEPQIEETKEEQIVLEETKDEEPSEQILRDQQSQLLRNQQQDQPAQILEPIQPEPPIIQPVASSLAGLQPEPPIIQPEPPIIQPEQIFIPHYKNYDFVSKLTDYSQPELENKYDEIVNEQLSINKLLNDELSKVGLTMPSNGLISYQFLNKYKDELTIDLLDLISYQDELQKEENRIEKKIIQLEKEKPEIIKEEPKIEPPSILKPEENPPSILKPEEKPPSILQPVNEEQQLVLYEPQKIKGSTSTATQQNIGSGYSSVPVPLPFLRPINADRLSNLFNIQGVALTPQETKDMRQNRLAIFDKKSDDSSFIGPRPSFTETISDKSEESQDVGVSDTGKNAFLTYIKQDYRTVSNKTLGQILINNGIKDPISGNDFYISPAGTVLIRNTKSATAKNRTYLTELLIKKYKPGFIY